MDGAFKPAEKAAFFLENDALGIKYPPRMPFGTNMLNLTRQKGKVLRRIKM